MSKTEIAMPYNSAAVKTLIDAGIVPAETTHFELTFAVDKPCTIKLTRFATEDEMKVISDAVITNRGEFYVETVDITRLASESKEYTPVRKKKKASPKVSPAKHTPKEDPFVAEFLRKCDEE